MSALLCVRCRSCFPSGMPQLLSAGTVPSPGTRSRHFRTDSERHSFSTGSFSSGLWTAHSPGSSAYGYRGKKLRKAPIRKFRKTYTSAMPPILTESVHRAPRDKKQACPIAEHTCFLFRSSTSSHGRKIRPAIRTDLPPAITVLTTIPLYSSPISLSGMPHARATPAPYAGSALAQWRI